MNRAALYGFAAIGVALAFCFVIEATPHASLGRPTSKAQDVDHGPTYARGPVVDGIPTLLEVLRILEDIDDEQEHAKLRHGPRQHRRME